MHFFQYVLVVSYLSSKRVYDTLYGAQAGKRAFILSGLYTATCQILFLLAAIAIIEKIAGVSPIQSRLAGFLILFLSVGWLIRGGTYYNVERVQSFAVEMNNKTVGQKVIWGVLTIAALLSPIFIIYLLWA